MNSTITKALLLLLAIGCLVSVLCNLSCRPTASLNHLANELIVSPPNVDALPDTSFFRVIAKERLAKELIAGRRSLWETAALFEALNQLPPAVPAGRDPNHPLVALQPRTHEEHLCVQVIYLVYGEHQNRNSGKADVARLEAEIHEELRKNGAIRLPDPSTLTPADQLIDEARRLWRDRQPTATSSGVAGTRP